MLIHAAACDDCSFTFEHSDEAATRTVAARHARVRGHEVLVGSYAGEPDRSITSKAVTAARRALPLVLAGLALFGCATARLTQSEEAKVAELQAFADRATTAYGKARVSIVPLEPGMRNAGATMQHGSLEGLIRGRPGLMFLKPSNLANPLVISLVAHELGHWMLDHHHMADRSRAAIIRAELAANVEGVRILQVGAGMKPHEAFGYMYLMLDSAARGIHAGSLGRAEGHPDDPCEEANHLVARFPQYARGVERINEWLRTEGSSPLACVPPK